MCLSVSEDEGTELLFDNGAKLEVEEKSFWPGKIHAKSFVRSVAVKINGKFHGRFVLHK